MHSMGISYTIQNISRTFIQFYGPTTHVAKKKEERNHECLIANG